MTAEKPGPVCSCTPWHEKRGQYAADCLVHASWRCVVNGCIDVATEGHMCVIHGRHLLPLDPWGIGSGGGESDRESDRYERWIEGA